MTNNLRRRPIQGPLQSWIAVAEQAARLGPQAGETPACGVAGQPGRARRWTVGSQAGEALALYLKSRPNSDGIPMQECTCVGLYTYPAIAQLVEHLTVECCSYQMVPGSIPGGRIFMKPSTTLLLVLPPSKHAMHTTDSHRRQGFDSHHAWPRALLN